MCESIKNWVLKVGPLMTSRSYSGTDSMMWWICLSYQNRSWKTQTGIVRCVLISMMPLFLSLSNLKSLLKWSILMNEYSNDASWANKTEANIIFREGGCTFIELFDHIPKNHISIPKKVWNWKIMLHNCYGWEKNMLIALLHLNFMKI